MAKDKGTHVYVSINTYWNLQELANLEDRKKSAVLARLIKDALDKEKAKRPTLEGL